MPESKAPHPDLAEREHSALVVWLLAMASVWHYTSSSNEIWEYWLHFHPVHTPAVAAICVVGFLAAIYSHLRVAALALSAAGIFVVGLRLPWIPTHLMMELFLYLGIAAAWVGLLAQTRSVDRALDGYWERYAPLGRWLLILMYFYGTFHKINPVFLSPETSCAVPFIKGVPIVSALADTHWMQLLAIYGTLIVEAAAMCMLLVPRLKYYGMLMGISFHAAIGISSFGTLAHFSAFALALHAFFLPSSAPRRFLEDQALPAWMKTRGCRQVATILIVMPPFAFALLGNWHLTNAHFGLAALAFMLFVFRYGRPGESSPAIRLVSPSFAVNVLAVAFVVNGAAPYIGLRTTGAVQMFSGLRTEGGVSNHYVIREPVYLFPYQRKTISVVDSSDWLLGYLDKHDLGTPWLNFQRYLTDPEQSVTLPFTILVNGERVHVQNARDLRSVFSENYIEENILEKLYLSFRHFELGEPKGCRH
ncbi:MAG: hypothetical protein U5R46_16090 [Gammaproteobacteria bacterium]|nr:hypothetical protein [Gammaproteobacteria bacterium]